MSFDPTNDTRILCSICYSKGQVIEASYVCRDCHNGFCSVHQNDLDESLCQECSPSDEDLQKSSVVETTLIDRNGFRHRGRDLHPVGENYQKRGMAIHEMSSSDLNEHIQKYKIMVKEAEILLEHRRIELSMSQLESLERDEAERRRIRSMKGIKTQSTTGVKIGGKNMGKISTKDASVGSLVDKLKKMGVTAEMLEKAAKKVAN
jgi:hypothetical protein